MTGMGSDEGAAGAESAGTATRAAVSQTGAETTGHAVDADGRLHAVGAQEPGASGHRMVLGIADLGVGVNITGKVDDLTGELIDRLGQGGPQERRSAIPLGQGSGGDRSGGAGGGFSGHAVLDRAAGLRGVTQITHGSIMPDARDGQPHRHSRADPPAFIVP